MSSLTDEFPHLELARILHLLYNSTRFRKEVDNPDVFVELFTAFVNPDAITKIREEYEQACSSLSMPDKGKLEERLWTMGLCLRDIGVLEKLAIIIPKKQKHFAIEYLLWIASVYVKKTSREDAKPLTEQMLADVFDEKNIKFMMAVSHYVTFQSLLKSFACKQNNVDLSPNEIRQILDPLLLIYAEQRFNPTHKSSRAKVTKLNALKVTLAEALFSRHTDSTVWHYICKLDSTKHQYSLFRLKFPLISIAYELNHISFQKLNLGGRKQVLSLPKQTPPTQAEINKFSRIPTAYLTTFSKKYAKDLKKEFKATLDNWQHVLSLPPFSQIAETLLEQIRKKVLAQLITYQKPEFRPESMTRSTLSPDMINFISNTKRQSILSHLFGSKLAELTAVHTYGQALLRSTRLLPVTEGEATLTLYEILARISNLETLSYDAFFSLHAYFLQRTAVPPQAQLVLPTNLAAVPQTEILRILFHLIGGKVTLNTHDKKSKDIQMSTLKATCSSTFNVRYVFLALIMSRIKPTRAFINNLNGTTRSLIINSYLSFIERWCDFWTTHRGQLPIKAIDTYISFASQTKKTLSKSSRSQLAIWLNAYKIPESRLTEIVQKIDTFVCQMQDTKRIWSASIKLEQKLAEKIAPKAGLVLPAIDDARQESAVQYNRYFGAWLPLAKYNEKHLSKHDHEAVVSDTISRFRTMPEVGTSAVDRYYIELCKFPTNQKPNKALTLLLNHFLFTIINTKSPHAIKRCKFLLSCLHTHATKNITNKDCRTFIYSYTMLGKLICRVLQRISPVTSISEHPLPPLNDKNIRLNLPILRQALGLFNVYVRKNAYKSPSIPYRHLSALLLTAGINNFLDQLDTRAAKAEKFYINTIFHQFYLDNNTNGFTHLLKTNIKFFLSPANRYPIDSRRPNYSKKYFFPYFSDPSWYEPLAGFIEKYFNDLFDVDTLVDLLTILDNEECYGIRLHLILNCPNELSRQIAPKVKFSDTFKKHILESYLVSNKTWHDKRNRYILVSTSNYFDSRRNSSLINTCRSVIRTSTDETHYNILLTYLVRNNEIWKLAWLCLRIQLMQNFDQEVVNNLENLAQELMESYESIITPSMTSSHYTQYFQSKLELLHRQIKSKDDSKDSKATLTLGQATFAAVGKRLRFLLTWFSQQQNKATTDIPRASSFNTKTNYSIEPVTAPDKNILTCPTEILDKHSVFSKKDKKTAVLLSDAKARGSDPNLYARSRGTDMTYFNPRRAKTPAVLSSSPTDLSGEDEDLGSLSHGCDPRTS